MKTAFILASMAGRPKRQNTPMRIGDETLGERFARLRKERGLTQTTLAKELGIIQPLISDYEHDRVRPNVKIIVALASALTVSVDELLGVSEGPKKRGRLSKLDKQIDTIRSLPRAEKEFVVRMIDMALRETEQKKSNA